METKRIFTGTYASSPKTGKQYRLYKVRVFFEDGRTKDFPSEEHYNAWLEDREPNFVFEE